MAREEGPRSATSSLARIRLICEKVEHRVALSVRVCVSCRVACAGKKSVMKKV
jgi:hypothetical protein